MAPITLKSPPELAAMREGGRLLAQVLRLLADMVEPGMSTRDLDRAAAQYLEEHGARAAFKGYRGFPASICTSLNEEVVHGIPGPRKLKEGDLLKIDAGVVWDGFFSDAAVSVPVGEVSDEVLRLMRATQEALNAGIAALRPGVRVSRISAAVQKVAEGHGFNVVRDYTGHGIGRALHEEPKVPNYVSAGVLRHDAVLPKGATVAIEPMVNVGTHRTQLLPNGWTVVTRDGGLSAHFEHTVAVDESGPVILTLP